MNKTLWQLVMRAELWYRRVWTPTWKIMQTRAWIFSDNKMSNKQGLTEWSSFARKSVCFVSSYKVWREKRCSSKCSMFLDRSVIWCEAVISSFFSVPISISFACKVLLWTSCSCWLALSFSTTCCNSVPRSIILDLRAGTSTLKKSGTTTLVFMSSSKHFVTTTKLGTFYFGARQAGLNKLVKMVNTLRNFFNYLLASGFWIVLGTFHFFHTFLQQSIPCFELLRFSLKLLCQLLLLQQLVYTLWQQSVSR